MSLLGCSRDVMSVISREVGLLGLVQLSATCHRMRRLCLHDDLWRPFMDQLALQRKEGASAYETVKRFHELFNTITDRSLPAPQRRVVSSVMGVCRSVLGAIGWTSEKKTRFEANLQRWRVEPKSFETFDEVHGNNVEVMFHLYKVSACLRGPPGLCLGAKDVVRLAINNKHLPILTRMQKESDLAAFCVALAKGEGAREALVKALQSTRCLPADRLKDTFAAVAQFGSLDFFYEYLRLVEQNRDQLHRIFHDLDYLRRQLRTYALQIAEHHSRSDLLHALLDDSLFGYTLDSSELRYVATINQDPQRSPILWPLLICVSIT